MDWKQLLVYITGSVEEDLLLRNEYPVAENRILRDQVKGRIQLRDTERRTLAEIGKKLSKQALEEVATIVKPDTILAWHRKLVAQKFDGSRYRKAPGRPRVDLELEELVLRMARENRSWGYDRIQGALKHLGYTLSDQTVGNILKRHGLPPAPEREKTTTWKEFIRSHRKIAGKPRHSCRGWIGFGHAGLNAQAANIFLGHSGALNGRESGEDGNPGIHAGEDVHLDVLVAPDFFTTEVWTWCGLVTYYILFFLHVGSRRVHIAGVTPHPNESWMMQIARNETMAEWGFLKPGHYLIHDRDGKYGPAFQDIIDHAGVNRVPLPPRSPNLNAFAERWVRSVKSEARSKLILFGERSLRHALKHYTAHFHQELPHQGMGNAIPFSATQPANDREGPIQCHERLGGLLKYYERRAA